MSCRTRASQKWIPAFARMTPLPVIPANAGIHFDFRVWGLGELSHTGIAKMDPRVRGDDGRVRTRDVFPAGFRAGHIASPLSPTFPHSGTYTVMSTQTSPYPRHSRPTTPSFPRRRESNRVGRVPRPWCQTSQRLDPACAGMTPTPVILAQAGIQSDLRGAPALVPNEPPLGSPPARE